MAARPLSVLCDLRPAFDGYYGIPHETRLMFRLLHDVDGVDVTGLINHPSQVLARTFRRRDRGKSTPQEIRAYSRLAASVCPPYGTLGRVQHRASTTLKLAWLQLLTKFGIPISLDHFDGTEFGDFLWQSLFAMSLAPADFEACRTASYASLWAPWRALHATALTPWPRPYARIDTRGHDVFIAQTPWPGSISPQTQMVVRYHDAVPIFLPHTAKQSRLHQRLHYTALKANATASAAFACVSEFSRTQLLHIFPELESRAMVVLNCIGDDYFPESAAREAAIKIISSRIDATTEPDLGPSSLRQAFYDAHLHRDDFRYILMVSTLEPRKNHLRLIAAREALSRTYGQPVAIVFVGSPGWGGDEVSRAVQRCQMQGSAFHLSSVPSDEMRMLYSAADAVVCPSVSEGFDLPSVEAIRCGAVVAASDIPTHREMLDDAALYFDPYSSNSMCDALRRILTDPELPKELRSKARSRAVKFDKSVVQEQWQKVFESIRKSTSLAQIDSAR